MKLEELRVAKEIRGLTKAEKARYKELWEESCLSKRAFCHQKDYRNRRL